jgi:hypothetical protein
MATRGGGPPFRIWGRTPVYEWGEAVAWAEKRLSPVSGSSSEADLPEGKGLRLRAEADGGTE